MLFFDYLAFESGSDYFAVAFVQSKSIVKRSLRAPPGMVFWCEMGAVFGILGDAILDLVIVESEGNVRHRPCPWFRAFGHLLAWCSGVLRARFLTSWGYHSGPCFLRIRKQRVRHRLRPWLGTFGHLLAWCSGVLRARFLASWGCHSGLCFPRIRKQR